ncbi:uncharacterized protein LOC123294248 [Chrysoperla carnea]|uniref:uncharacterized protein LOC123294248 n=1 Tax=Chrysoperla carnea TaxID=189513 RepID=UPI001D08F8C2|nr:uncharacterized protein LOC123294248 [Chrysoperla carnea]
MFLVIIGVLIALYLLHLYFMKGQDYWKKRGVPTYQRSHPYKEFIRLILQKTSIYEDFLSLYNGFPDKKVYGVNAFNVPQLVVKDPEILKNICVKDFDHFVNHIDVFFKADPLFGRSLFAIKDKKWRDMRNILTPVFTGSKLRGLVQLISNCGEQTVKYLTEKCKEQDNKLLKVDLLDMTTRFTNDVIATAAFGIEVNSIQNPNNEFFEAGREIIKFPAWRVLIMFFLPTIAKIFEIRLAPKYVYNFLYNIINETIRVREEKHIVRPDMVHLLVEGRKEQKRMVEEKSAKNEDVSSLTNSVLTNDDIVAQGFIFFLAGYGNVAIIMSFAAYELAVQPELQKRLQDEIAHTLKENNGKLDYDVIKKMKYLDMVIAETLRKWTPVTFIDRECTKAYQIKSDDLTVDVEPGMAITIPTVGFHYDPKYFPNPNKFDPERFSDENKEKMNPYVYMPFGLGPRVCIAVRFVLLETKIFLINLLTQFDVVVTEKTPIPMVLKAGNTVRPKDGFNLALKLRIYLNKKEYLYFWIHKMILEIIGVLIVIYLLHLYFMKGYDYWEKRGIPSYRRFHPYIEFLNMLFQRTTMYDDIIGVYNGLPDKKVHGINILKIPQVFVKDPDILRNICVKDFDHFVNHVDIFLQADPLFGKSLFVLKDKKWRDMRNILTPVFTGSKLRGLVQLISNCGEKTVNHLVEELKEQNTKLLKIDIMDTATRFTNDVIATSAFGIEVNSIKDPKNDFFMAGREIIRFPMWRFFMMFFLPAVSKILDIRLAPRYVYDFLFNIINETIRVREEKNIIRPDMVHLLIEARKEQKKVIQQKQAQNEDVSVLTKNLLTNEDIVAQGFIFFFAGYGNVAVILSFAAYELAVHPEIQKRLQDEISHVLNENNGQLDYDAIKKMKYLDMVLSETLRKWPPLPIIDRECTKAYQIKSDDLTIDLAPGMGVQIPIAGFHYDPKYYPNPEKFDPERFSDENKANMNPYVYMPFGLGPRVCVAVRFVMIETKILLIHLLRQFDIVVTEKTPIPMVLKSGNVIRPKGDFNLALVSRNE